MNIAIVNTLSIPSGQASVNRILSYGKELFRLGNSVSILSSGNSDIYEGNIDGIKYHCFGHLGNLKALISILSRIKKERFDCVILVSNSLFLIYPLAIVCFCLRIKYFQEKSEFPFVLMRNGFFQKLFAELYVNTTYKLFDGLIVMTKPLMNYFNDKVRKSAKLFEMPMTVDIDRFSIPKSTSPYGSYIAYCGDMAGNKDGVRNLIEAYHLASKEIGDVKLLLIGGSSNQDDFNKLQEYAIALNNNGIIFYGRASRNDIPQLLVNAKALALARPSSLQSTGGFPTKLGEYLSTGNPVVVTKVGDIPSYLNDDNAFTVEPDDNKAFALAIVEIFQDYSSALIKAKKGKMVAITIFNAKVQTLRLFEFLKATV